MNNFDHILAKGDQNGRTPLTQHLSEVAKLAEIVALNIGLDTSIARRGAILHDIGKAIDQQIQGSHIEIGIKILEKFSSA